MATSGGSALNAASDARYNSRVGLTNFQAALANAANAPCNILLTGASRGEGYGVTAMSNRYVDLVTKALQTKYNGAIPVGGKFYSAQYFGNVPWTTPWTYAGGGPIASSTGPGGKGVSIAAGQTQTITVTGTSMDVIYATGPLAGILTYKIGAAAAVQINTFSGGNVDMVKTNVALPGGAQTVQIGVFSGTCFFDGLYVYNGDEAAGVRVYECCQSSRTSPWFAGLSNVAGFNVLAGWGAYCQPHLVIVADFLINDPGAGGITPAQSIANIDAGLAAIAAANPNVASKMLAIPQRSTLVPNIAAWQQAGRAYTGATPFYDESLRTPDPNVDGQGCYYDFGHWNNKGNLLVGDNLAAAIDIR